MKVVVHPTGGGVLSVALQTDGLVRLALDADAVDLGEHALDLVIDALLSARAERRAAGHRPQPITLQFEPPPW